MYVYIVQDKNNNIVMIYEKEEDAIDYAKRYSGVNNPHASEALYSVTSWFVIKSL